MEKLYGKVKEKVESLINNLKTWNIKVPEYIWNELLRNNAWIKNDETVKIGKKLMEGKPEGFNSYLLDFKDIRNIYFRNEKNILYKNEWNKIRNLGNIVYEIIYIIEFWKFFISLIKEPTKKLMAFEHIENFKNTILNTRCEDINKICQDLKNNDVYPDNFVEGNLPFQTPILLQEIDNPDIYKIYYEFANTTEIKTKKEKISTLWENHLRKYNKNKQLEELNKNRNKNIEKKKRKISMII